MSEDKPKGRDLVLTMIRRYLELMIDGVDQVHQACELNPTIDFLVGNALQDVNPVQLVHPQVANILRWFCSDEYTERFAQALNRVLAEQARMEAALEEHEEMSIGDLMASIRGETDDDESEHKSIDDLIKEANRRYQEGERSDD